MPLYRVQHELQMVSGVPNDKSTNVFHFIADDLTALDLAIIQVTTFFGAVDNVMSALVATTGHRIRAYDLDDVEPRAPVRDFTTTYGPFGTGTLPPEIALCCSIQGPRQSGVSQARRRGRFYVGPLQASATGTDGRFTSTFLNQVGPAFQNLLDASHDATTWALAVYSRVNDTAIEVTNGWIDNAPDVQRRRGVQPTSRTLYVGA